MEKPGERFTTKSNSGSQRHYRDDYSRMSLGGLRGRSRLFLQLAEFRRAVLRIELRIDVTRHVADDEVRVENKGPALSEFRPRALDAVGADRFVLRIDQQIERKAVLFMELLLRADRICRNTVDLGILRLDQYDGVAECASLCRAARSACLGIEI